jgi:hypothetical protein
MSETATVEEVKAQSVNLDDIATSLIEENIELNPDANPMEAPPPVDDGTWRVKLIGATDWTQKDTKPNAKTGNSTTYLSTQFSGVVIAEGTTNNNKRVFGRVNTLVFEGKSEMGYILLQVYGGKQDPEARRKVEALKNYGELAKAFRDALAGEPIIRVSTKWVAQYNAGTKESPKYQTAKSGQKNFPSDGKGGNLHVINVPNVGEIAARAEIQDYFPG